MGNDYTPEEILEANDRNETFSGRVANMEKVRLYRTIEAGLTAFAERCEYAASVGGFAPNPREKHAILWLDLSPAAILDRAAIDGLGDLMQKADGAVIATVDDHVRITFDVKNIWEV